MKVHVGTRPGFERKGSDIYTTVQIPFTTAVFGGEVMVETLTGRVLCKIRKGTQSGSKIRLKGKGVPTLRNKNIRGTHIVKFVVQVPEKLNAAQKEALRKFQEAMGEVAPSEKKEEAPAAPAMNGYGWHGRYDVILPNKA